jgi:hypothetical protein
MQLRLNSNTVTSEIGFPPKCKLANISFALPRRFGVELSPIRDGWKQLSYYYLPS